MGKEPQHEVKQSFQPAATLVEQPELTQTGPISQPQEPTLEEKINASAGLNQFMARVYATTGFGIMAALGVGLGLGYYVPGIDVESNLFIGAGIASFLGFAGVTNMSPVTVREKLPGGGEAVRTHNGWARWLLFGVGTSGLGATMAPLLQTTLLANPWVIPSSICLAGAIFGGATLMALRSKPSSVLKWWKVLNGSLLGLLGLQLLGLGSLYLYGPTPFATILFNYENWLGIFLFTAFVVKDTQMAAAHY